MKIVLKKTKDLIEYENNPRNNDEAVEAVAKSIEEFGFKVPIVITSENIIIAGHTRLKASKKLGLDEVPCIIADDLTDEQIKAFRLADNKTAELATWDLSKLEEELLNIDMDMLQFGFEDLESDLPDNATDDDFDPDAEIPEVPVSQKGDLYVLGKHRVLCGDSTLKEDVDYLINEKLVDMIFTDPPYNVDYEGTAGKIQNDKMEDSTFYLFLLDAFTNMFENTKKGGAIYVCHADTEGLNFRNAYKNAGFKLAECLIWVKNALVLGRQDYHWRHEPILYGWKEGAAHYFIDDRTQDTIWEYNKPKRNEEHPTMKPLELVGKAIANSSRVDETVLDLFGGSGSTLIAADQLGRSAYLMELDEKFVDVIIKRFVRYKEGNNDGFYRIREGVKTPLSEILEFNL
ncbi:MAG: ParB N-terminal domain-containing protein [Clostridiales bacterium]|jgi:DNA modification methylase|nr:ParB N-terminal domain-containing protein [Bacilli bacterium]NLZ80451.1 ParB N-terminal domain-containing protein [Clostridiales bacterium]HOD61433.1 DNA modification methylase [Bacilli bacterium]HOR17384.1 DNA modification methylase [Bacilli bacterium]HQQ39660.1 DNA modification methylase [Bacilli bacterium]